MITNRLPKKTVMMVYRRLLVWIGTNNYSTLARHLGCNSRQHLDNIKRKGRIPTNRVINYALAEGINLNDLFNPLLK